MEKFNSYFYNNFHLDIKCLNLNEQQLKESYKNFGLQEGRLCCEEDFYILYPEFDLDFYNTFHKDLSIFNNDKFSLMNHFHNYGLKEGRLINKKYLNLTLKKKIFDKNLFPFLFHKYVLNLIEKKDLLNYQIINSNLILNKKILKKEIAHIHCYKISFLQTMFSSYLKLIDLYFEIIVTFNILDDENVINNQKKNIAITFIKCENKGYDVGSRFVVANFLKDLKKDYNYIFYIHSKSNEEKRREYLEPFIVNFEKIKFFLKDGKIGGIFNDIIYCGNQVLYIHNQLVKADLNNLHWENNDIYMNELIKYFQLNKENYLFSEGNFFILHRNVIELLFLDPLLYYILNNETSFDYNWVKKNYGIKEINVENVYNEYKKRHLFGNNLETKLGWKGFADGMIEHAFERLPMILTNHLKMEIKIISKCNSPNISLIEKLVNSEIKDKNNYHYF